jgi:flagellin
MSLSIRTNLSSLNAQRNLSQTQNQLDTSMSRLSSGMRITKASDDAAGLGISVNLEAQVRSYNQAARNANDGISFVQAAESSLNEVTNILSRLRELATQAASDGVGSSSTDPGRAAIITEATQLTGELDRIDKTAEYNNTKFFNASASGVSLNFLVGVRGTANDSLTIDMASGGLGASSAWTVDSTRMSVGSIATNLDTSAHAATYMAAVDTALNRVSSMRATLGAIGNRFQTASNSVQAASESLSAANSRIRDVDVAAETAQLSRAQILSQAGVSVLAQANQLPQMALKLLG